MPNYLQVIPDPTDVLFPELEGVCAGPLETAYARFFEGSSAESRAQIQRRIQSKRLGEIIMDEVAIFKCEMGPFKACLDALEMPTKKPEDDEILRFLDQDAAERVVLKMPRVKMLIRLLGSFEKDVTFTKEVAAFFAECRSYVDDAFQEAVETALRWITSTKLRMTAGNVEFLHMSRDFQGYANRQAAAIDAKLEELRPRDPDRILSMIPLLRDLSIELDKVGLRLNVPGRFENPEDFEVMSSFYEEAYSFIHDVIIRTLERLNVKPEVMPLLISVCKLIDDLEF